MTGIYLAGGFGLSALLFFNRNNAMELLQLRVGNRPNVDV